MAKHTKLKGMHGDSDKKTRGRSSISMQRGGPDMGPNPTKPNVPQEMLRDVNRPQSPGGGGKHRGDRRDMNPTYTGNAKHKARGNNPRKDVSTRKR